MRAVNETAFAVLAASVVVALASEPRAHSIRIPCEIIRDMIYVRASINGSRPLSLNLDTGASHSVINPELATALGLKQSGSGEASGIGTGQSTKFGRVEGTTIEVGGRVLRNQSILTLSMSFLASQLGHPTDGTLGSNIFANYIVRTAYSRREIELEDPVTWNPSGAGVAIPVQLRDNMPFISATLTLPSGNYVAGNFLVDSGQIGAALALNKAFQDAHPDLSLHHAIQMPPANAVGGNFRYKITRIPALRIGQFTLKDPITVLPEQAAGIEADPELAGIIGADVLSRFTVTFDYPHGKMFLAPNERFAAPFETDMSGLRLTTHPPLFNQFEVNGVTAQSPASEAGIRDGDMIGALDSRPAANLTLDAIQESLERPGEVRHLLLQRGTHELRVDLHLRRLV
jgi:hypothetical protein